jgi:hypothetical protein
MPTTYVLPNAAALVETLEMLFGGKGPITPGKRLDPKPGSGYPVANYINDTGKTVAAVYCDLEFAAYAGSALSMLPAAAAKEAIKKRQLEPAMLENLYEVMNILSTLLMNEHTPHLKLDALHPDPGKIPADAKGLLSKPAGRADFTVNVPRYGSGNLALLVV